MQLKGVEIAMTGIVKTEIKRIIEDGGLTEVYSNLEHLVVELIDLDVTREAKK